MKTSMFAFSYDFLDEGVDEVLDNVQLMGGVGGVSIAAAYHAGRDFFPHNPKRRIRFLDAGTVFFHPDEALYAATPIKPVVAPEFVGTDMVRTVVAATQRRGMAADAWTVYFHTDRGAELEEFAPRNAFGDPYLTDICPLNPASQEYALALTRDIASAGVASISAESLHFALLEHGFHHERFFVTLTEFTRYLLAICFCDSCIAVAATAGLDGGAARSAVATLIDEQIAGADQPDFSRDAVDAVGDGALGSYLAAQRAGLTSLIGRVVAVAAEYGTTVKVVDISGVMKGYLTGAPTGPAAVNDAWKFGLDHDAIYAVGGSISVTAYMKDPERLAFELDGYRKALPKPFSVVLRPSPPDSTDAAQMTEKIRIVSGYPIEQVGFYCYGLVHLDGLMWIRSGLEALDASS